MFFKNYKKLYKQQMNNNKIMNERYLDIEKRYVDYQKQTKEEIKSLREQIARLKIELEDTNGFLEQEKAVSTALRKERTSLKKRITKLGKSVNPRQTIAVAYAIVQQAESENISVKEVIDKIILEEKND